VKITGAVPTPLAAIESVCDDLLELIPDSILSMTEMMPLPTTSCPAIVPSNDMVNEVCCGGVEANELDEFLLDAVSWL
jgi:hypothetical protein